LGDKPENQEPLAVPPQIAVIGPEDASEEELSAAIQVGRIIAREGAFLLCGGKGGVMDAACRGAREEGGMTVGIVPDAGNGNPHLSIVIRTNIGNARNAVLVQSAEAVVAIGGAYGTLSEIALALKSKREVFGLSTWEIDGIRNCTSAEDAVLSALSAARRSPWYRNRRAGREFP
jgi:uncharacterized protein (TIGR00725 family)